MKIKAFDIRYATGGRKVNLPSELILNIETDLSNDPLMIGELDDLVADAISEKTGWCVFGFEYEKFLG